MSDPEYDLGKEYPPKGKRVPNLLGYAERDAEGFVWLSFMEEKPKEKVRPGDNDSLTIDNDSEK